MTVRKINKNELNKIYGGTTTKDLNGNFKSGDVYCIDCGNAWTIHNDSSWKFWKQRYKGSEYKYRCPRCGNRSAVTMSWKENDTTDSNIK